MKNGNSFLEKEKTGVYPSVMAVTRTGYRVLIDTDPSLYETEVIDNSDNLTDIITDYSKTSIPQEFGVYKFDLNVKTFKSNHPLDPEEWDISIWANNFKKIELSV